MSPVSLYVTDGVGGCLSPVYFSGVCMDSTNCKFKNKAFNFSPIALASTFFVVVNSIWMGPLFGSYFTGVLISSSGLSLR